MEEEASQEDTYFFVASLLLFLTSLLTNGIILAVTRKSTVFKDTGQARTVIRHTAVVDIFAALDCLMSALGYFDKRLITGNRVVCGLDAFRAGVSKSQAHNALILLALNRYFLVVQPQTCHRVFSKRMTLIYIACFWVISFMISIILRVLNHYPEYSSTFGSCFYSPNSVSGPVLFSFRVISVLLIVACYIGIYWRIRKQRNRMQQHKRQEKVAGSPPSLTMAQIRDTLRSERSSEQLDSRNPQADVKNASEVPSGSTSLECVSEYQPSNCEDRSESKKREYKKTEEASEENSAVENDTYYESTDTQASKSRRSADEIHAISFVNPESFFPRTPAINKLLPHDNRENFTWKQPMCVLSRSSRSRAKSTTASTTNQAPQRQSKNNLLAAIVSITVFYFLTSTPSMALTAYKTLPVGPRAAANIRRFALLLYYTNYSINFVMFGIIKKKFRVAVQKLFGF